MTTFKEMVSDDLAVFFDRDEHAETVAYNGTDIPAIVESSSIKDEDSVSETAFLWVLVSDVPAPSYRDSVLIGSVTWRVQQGPYSRDDNNVWRLPIVSNERPVL